MRTQNSALIALSHLRQLEADRVTREQQAHQAAADAERLALEHAEQRERELAERRAAEEAARLHAERMARLERDRQDRMRIAEAEARARAAHDAQLRQEQMRLEAQVRLSERRTRPRWPLAVVPVLVLGLFGMAGLGWHSQAVAEREAAERVRAEHLAASGADAIAKVNEKLAQLEADQQRLAEQRDALQAQLDAAEGDAAKAELLEKIDKVDKSIADNDKARRKAGKASRKSRKSRKGRTSGAKASTTKTTKATTTKRTRPKLDMGGTDDPLGGIH